MRGALDGAAGRGKHDGAPDRLDHPGGGKDARVEVHGGALPLQADLRTGRSREPVQGSLYPAGSERADHAGDGQLRAAVAGGLLQGRQAEQASHGGHPEITQLQFHSILPIKGTRGCTGTTVVIESPRVKGNPGRWAWAQPVRCQAGPTSVP